MGSSEIEMMLRRQGKGYVLGVSGAHPFSSWIGKPEVGGTAEEIAEELDESAWQRLSAGAGTKGERLYDWAYCELADLEADEDNEGLSGVWTRGLLIRRSLNDGELAFFSTWCPAGTPIETLVAVEGRRWAIEDAFETAKTELRSGSQRDPLLAWLAPARLARDAGLRDDGCGPASREPPTAPKKNQPGASERELIRWSVQEIRRIAIRLAQRRICPTYIIAWSVWRRAHQAAAQEAHIKRKSQL